MSETHPAVWQKMPGRRLACPRHLAYGKTSFPDAYRPYGLHLPFAQCYPLASATLFSMSTKPPPSLCRAGPVKLVHGNEVHHYQQPLPTRPDADAVFTAVAGQKVGVVTADCLPMLIASRDGRSVCSVHAGWQGLVSGIVDNSLACFRQQGWHWPIWSSPWGRIFTLAVTKSPPDFISNCWTSPAVIGWPAIASGCFIPVRARSAIRSKPPHAAAIICGLICAPLPKRSSQRRECRRRALNGWGVAPTAPLQSLGPTDAGPIFRRRRAFSIRGSCARPEARSR